MKKILFLINSLGRGGAERVFLNQSNYLHQKGYKVFLGLLFPSPADNYRNELKLPAENIFQMRENDISLISFLLQLNKIIHQHEINVVYSTLELPNILARLLKILNPRLSVIIREGSAVVDKKGRTSIKPFKFRLLDWFLNWLPVYIVAVSEEIGMILKGYQPIYANKVIVVENGVMVNESRETIKERLDSKNNSQKLKILAVASMNYYERAFEYLIDAINLLPKNLLENVSLVFAGDGILRPMYEKQVNKLNLDNHIRFLGRLNTVDLIEQYKQADVFVLCSTSEGSPNVIIEAMSYGVPVITTRVGSAVNMVSNEETGFFIPFKDSRAIADKLIWFFNYPEKRREMGLKSYDRVTEHFSFDKKMAQMIGILSIDKKVLDGV